MKHLYFLLLIQVQRYGMEYCSDLSWFRQESGDEIGYESGNEIGYDYQSLKDKEYWNLIG